MTMKTCMNWLCYAFFLTGCEALAPSPQQITLVHRQHSTLAKEFDPRAVGVGFHLSSSYGTVSFAFPNGTIVDVAKVEADADYTYMMQKFSDDDNQHYFAPYIDYKQYWVDRPRQILRKARKLLGKPASEDVEHIAKVLAALQYKAELALGTSIKSVVVSNMNLVAIYKEDIEDALEYIGMQSMKRAYNYDGTPLYESLVSNIGYGFNLCPNYTDVPNCLTWQSDAELTVPYHEVLLITYTKTAVSHAYFAERGIRSVWQPRYRYDEDFSLGYGNNHVMGYWERVFTELAQAKIRGFLVPVPDRVIFSGESANNEKFLEVARDALGYLSRESWNGRFPDSHVSDHPEFIASRGTAELAKRIRYFDEYCKLHSSIPICEAYYGVSSEYL